MGEEEGMSENDIKEPILVLIRRGRGGKGFAVSPVDDVTNPAPCVDEAELAKAIIEMLDDKNQPRVNAHDLLNAAAEVDEPEGRGNGRDEDDEDGEGEGEEEDDSIFAGVRDADDPTDRLIINVVSSLIKKGQEMSNPKKRSAGRRSGRRGRR